MADKTRTPSKSEAASCTIASAGQFTKKSHGLSHEEPVNDSKIKEQLSKARQDLDKAHKIARSLARNCARAEQELRSCHESFALVAQHGSDIIFRLNRHGKFLEASPACQAHLGIAPDNLVGRVFQDYIALEEQEPLRLYFQSVLRGSLTEGRVFHLRFSNHGNKALVLFCKAMPHPQTQLLEILGLARPAQPRESTASSQDQLAFSLAHELNQPLTALAIAARACCQLTRAGEVDRADLIQTIDMVAVQAERAGELVRRMRQMAGGGKTSRSSVAVQDLVQGALGLCQADLNKEHVMVELHVSSDIPKIAMDRIQIEQVMVNLIRNAIEAMDEMPVAERVLVLAASQNAGELVIVVSDTGRGVSPVIAERLFQPYQTTKTQGMGLGLAISRAILQAHAGRLWVEQARGPGATFCLALPLVSSGS